MVPATFTYHKAASVSDAIQKLQEFGDEAKILAGGHSLIPTMKLRLFEPSHLIDISKLADLRNISKEGDEIIIGACCTHYEVISNRMVRRNTPLLSETGILIGDMQVRNAGTIGGSLAHPDPAADWPAAMLASGATLRAQGPNGSRDIAASDYFLGMYTTALEDGEILTEIRIPIPGNRTRSSYQKFMQPASRFALVGCAVQITTSHGSCDDIQVAFNGVSGAAFRDAGVENALKGQKLSEENISQAASQAAENAKVLSDHFASEGYRKHLAKVYAKRAIQAAIS